MLTEVNMNVATYIKFDDISNAIVDIKPTKLATLGSTSGEQSPASSTISSQQTRSNSPFQLDASFNAALAFNSAIDKLNGVGGTGSPVLGAAVGQQTPSLGKC